MKAVEFLLRLVGLEPMTNKDVLLAELSELSGEQFETLVLSRQSDFPERLDGLMCADCEEQNDGVCPNLDDDDGCKMTLGKWLEMECTRETLLGDGG